MPVDEIDLYENKNNIVEAKIEIDEFTDNNEFGSKAVRRKTRNSHFLNLHAEKHIFFGKECLHILVRGF